MGAAVVKMGRKRSKNQHKEGKKKEWKEKRGDGEPQQLGAVVIKTNGSERKPED